MSVHKQPWDDWIPGVLSKAQMKRLFDDGLIMADRSPQLGASSVDLTLSPQVFLLPEGAIKPAGSFYRKDIGPFSEQLSDMTAKGMELNARHTYLVKLNERVPHLKDSPIYGQATAKSSVGRIDVLARLVVDGMNCYEYFSPEAIGSGDLYIEITPLTFPVRIKPDISLSQLRLFYGKPENCLISGVEAYRTFLKNTVKDDGTLSVDLSPEAFHDHEIIAFRAKEQQTKPVPLWRTGPDEPSPVPWEYWDLVRPNKSQRLSLRKGSFYILKSKELLALPRGVAVYCRASDESFGEMRIHYAGFAHPLFGRTRGDGKLGTPLIFEVRGHDVNVSLGHGESMARLLFYRMSEDAEQSDEQQDYGNQTLQLSKFFGDWPERIQVDKNGAVQPH